MPREDLPHIQFYIGDWRRDVGVQSLSYYHRGVWVELLMLMHCSEERGRLVLSGKPMTDAAISRLLGLTQRETTDAIDVLLAAGVPSRDERGALICRRMVKEEATRLAHKEAGRLGGLSKAAGKPLAKPKQNPDIDIGNDIESGKRIAAIYGRMESTPWSEKEKKAWKAIQPVDDEELAMLERYYAAERKKPENICRRDLLTLLNNFRGEIDRARSWCEKHPLRAARVVQQQKPQPVPTQENEEQYSPEKIAERQRMVRELSEKLRRTEHGHLY